MEKEREFKKSEFLYDVPGSHFRNMSYETAIKEKIGLGEKLKNKLSNLIFSDKLNKEEKMKLNERLYMVMKAIEFNRLLIEEMNGKI